jgi:Flp pilus assembly pilin Flp
MNNKPSLVEVGFLACVVAVATIAFTLMVGNAIWKRMAGESARPAVIG